MGAYSKLDHEERGALFKSQENTLQKDLRNVLKYQKWIG